MKKVLLKALTFLTVLVMIGSLTGCGKKESISIYRCTFTMKSPDTAEVLNVENAINDYLAKTGAKYKIKLNDIGSGEYAKKTDLALKNGEVNLLWTSSKDSTISTDTLWKENAVYDITNLIKDTELEESLPAWIWSAAAYDEKTYFVPCYKETVEGYDIIFRSDLAKKYRWNTNAIKTLKDIEPMLADCKAEGIKYPYLSQKTAMFHKWYLDDFDFFSQDSFLAINRDTNTIVNPILTPKYADFCKLMGNWYKKGYIHQDDVTNQTNLTATQNQDWGFTWQKCTPDGKVADSLYGQAVEAVSITKKYSNSTTSLDSCFTITANSTENKAKACIDFLGKLYSDKELANLFSFWEAAFGFRLDLTPIANEYTACKKIFEEYGYLLENGGIAPANVESTITTYQSKLDEAGYQKVLAEAQKQYNAWKN